MRKLTFATRPSALARWQTQAIITALQTRDPEIECIVQVVTTVGDRILNLPLPEIGGKGVFTEELEEALLDGTVDCAVHSLKDLPVATSPGLCIGCIPTRADARDVLVSARRYTLLTLPEGAVVGTSSLRRSAQLLHLRPDLQVQSLRGNVDTRLRKALAGQYDAILLAGAGLARLGLQDSISEWLPLEMMLPAPGQGALAVQCRQEDISTRILLAALEDPLARAAVSAERAFLHGLGGGCALPIAAFATAAGPVHLTGLVTSLDGRQMVRLANEGSQPEETGLELARAVLAQGGAAVLQQISAGVGL